MWQLHFSLPAQTWNFYSGKPSPEALPKQYSPPDSDPGCLGIEGKTTRWVAEVHTPRNEVDGSYDARYSLPLKPLQQLQQPLTMAPSRLLVAERRRRITSRCAPAAGCVYDELNICLTVYVVGPGTLQRQSVVHHRWWSSVIERREQEPRIRVAVLRYQANECIDVSPCPLALNYKPMPCCVICDFLQRVSTNFLPKTINYFITVHTPRNEIPWQADIRRIILVKNSRSSQWR